MEMDERTMIALSALHLPLPLVLGVAFAGGLMLGFVYFRALRATADLIVGGGSPWLGLALTVARLVGIAGAFYVAVQAGGLAVVAALAGVLCAKAVILRQTRKEEA
jgi:hypothetical protein